MKTLYVRINPRKEANCFWRCGIQFGLAWQLVRDLDDATAQRLEEEQMLEVTETRPADLADDEPAGDSAVAIVPDADLSAPPVFAPAVEAPAVEAPAVEAPAVEAPAVEAPAVEAPAVEAPAATATKKKAK